MPENIWLPIEIVQYVVDRRMYKPLAIYLFLKMKCSGKLHAGHPVFSQLKKELGIRDERTFKKHFQSLLQLDWIGYSAKSGIYFIRSLDRVRQIHGFRKRQACAVQQKDLTQLQAFSSAAIINYAVRKHEYYVVFKKTKNQSALSKREVASQIGSKSFSTPKYYGLSVQSIAELLGCSLTRACQLKKVAVEAGYIKVNHQFELVQELVKADYFIREQYYQLYPEYKPGTLRFMHAGKNAPYRYKLVQQLHDEIIPQIAFKSRQSFSKISCTKAH